MDKKRAYLFGGTVGLLCLAYVTSIAISQPLVNNILIERVEHTFKPSGQLATIATIQELARVDGSRSIRKWQTLSDEKSPTGWQTYESHTVYNAKDRTVSEIWPALGRYGSTPLGDQNYRPLKALSTCASTLPSEAYIIRSQKLQIFDRTLEQYELELADPSSSRKWIITIDMFPDLGCLIGNRTTEVRNKTDNKMVFKKISSVSRLSVAPDDPLQFSGPSTELVEAKPSEILKKHYEVMKRECPSCAIDAGIRFDQRHQRLWDERKDGRAANSTP